MVNVWSEDDARFYAVLSALKWRDHCNLWKLVKQLSVNLLYDSTCDSETSLTTKKRKLLSFIFILDMSLNVNRPTQWDWLLRKIEIITQQSIVHILSAFAWLYVPLVIVLLAAFSERQITTTSSTESHREMDGYTCPAEYKATTKPLWIRWTHCSLPWRVIDTVWCCDMMVINSVLLEY